MTLRAESTGAERIVETRSDDRKARQGTETERVAAEQAEGKAGMAVALEKAATAEAAERAAAEVVQREAAEKVAAEEAARGEDGSELWV